MPVDQSVILSQLGVFISLQEDIQCRYSLARSRLLGLLGTVNIAQNNNSHTQYYLRKQKKSEDDPKILQAYQDCMQLQLQWNLAHRAIARLRRAVGMKPNPCISTQSSAVLLKDACSDKLRVLAEGLLDTLISMTHASPSVPQLPVTLYSAFTPAVCESLFRDLCISGTKRMQVHTGMLLVRICGNQNWWGEFLGHILQEFFVTEQPLVFPQDR